jgi:hypothetical protein
LFRDLYAGECGKNRAQPTRPPATPKTTTTTPTRDPIMELFNKAKNRYDNQDEELTWQEELT